MDFGSIDDENFLLFAAKSYYRPRCNDVNDFYEDLHRIKYIKRLINRFMTTGNLSERLLLNHIIVVGNSFTVAGALRILEFKIDKKSWTVLKPFLIYLRYIHKDEYNNIASDEVVEQALREI